MSQSPSPEATEDGAVARAVHRTRVDWMDTDGAGHHHNTAIVRFVEGAEATLVRERGIDGFFGTTPRVRYEVDFKSTLWFDQEVTTILRLEHIGTTSMRFRFEVWGEETDRFPRRLAATGRYVVVYVPQAGYESAPWPAEWLTALKGEPRS